VRSTEAFTEPLVNFLVDLHWRKGQLVRQYTLLLDPPGFGAQNRLAQEISDAAEASAPFAPAAPDLPAAPAAATPILERKIQTVARQVDPPGDRPNASGERAARKTARIRVGAKATLRGIAWRIGERSASDLQRMMIALFRANPGAFDGNINRLHLGAMLNIPTNAELEAITQEEAKREFHLHMAAWRGPVHAMHASASSSTTSLPLAAATVAPPGAETDQLSRRVQLLEHEILEVQGVLENQQSKLISMRQQVAVAEKTAPVRGISVATALSAAVPSAAAASRATGTAGSPLAAPKSFRASLAATLGGLGVLSGAFAAFYFRLRRRAPLPNKLPIDSSAAPATARNAAGDNSQIDAAKSADRGLHRNAAPGVDPDEVFSLTMPTRVTHTASSISSPDLEDTIVGTSGDTVKLPVDPTQFTRVEATQLDYNLMDLDMTAQYVHLPSALNEQTVFKERRTNLADVLKSAIEREPDRHDLRMKLLELYYSAAATNRQAFLEVVQKYARDRNCLDTDQWNKIAFMGRQIASENPLFAEPAAADDDLADCA
jgi:pilus assembly protein FimV